MKKKEIEKIPFRGGVRADKQYRNTAVAFLQDIRGENHLFVEVYENKKQELQTPWIRMVFTQKDWGLYYPDAGAWSAAAMRTFGSIPFSRLREISFWEEWLRGKVDKKGRPWIE